ncbi:hypothetical protein Q5P01_000524 [Channa striata]|uniref:Uncharacterized protein n=1 Tax=Channa striata TaxID=64152 RepID=A0AA88IHL1_CHASR|nr:hypothetical protein Q5P01_000524 [Channa striata]
MAIAALPSKRSRARLRVLARAVPAEKAAPALLVGASWGGAASALSRTGGGRAEARSVRHLPCEASLPGRKRTGEGERVGKFQVATFSPSAAASDLEKSKTEELEQDRVAPLGTRRREAQTDPWPLDHVDSYLPIEKMFSGDTRTRRSDNAEDAIETTRR